MKLFVPALVFALTQLALPGASENQLRSVDESWPGYGVTFLDDSPLPDTMLMASESAHFSVPSTTCTATSTGNAKLEVLVSKCLSTSKLADIKAWIQLFVKTLTFGVPSSITVVVSPVPGACPGSLVLLSEGDDDDRFAIFNDIATVVDVFGAAAPATDASSNATTVVSTDATADVSANVTSEALLADLVLPNGLPSIAAMKSIGIVSFVDTYSSATLVEQYELNLEAASFNFFVCNSLLNCLTCSTCKVTADINMIDPYTVTTALQCPNHQNAIPVSYLESGERKCVCQCPPGYKRKSSGVGCEKVGGTVSSCSWATTQGFEVPNTATGTCAVSNIADKGVPVPVAIDNYVAKGRTNTFSTPGQLSTGPFIKLLNGDGTTSTYYEWDDYRLHRKAKIDALTFNSYGKYTLKITAKDYQSEAVCTGCLTIVDNVRPSTTAECPAAYQVAGAEPSATATTLTAIRAKVDTFFNFQPSAVNDGCSSARCDAESITAVQFPGSTSQAPAYTSTAAKAFFSEANIRSELTSLGALATTALSTSTPVTSGQCRRCLTLATTLKEYWTDYNCVGADAAPVCAGTQSCSYTQCYTVSGDSIATQTVSIKSSVKDASQQVINQIEDRASFNKDTQVHFPLSHCDQFASSAADASAACKTSQKLDELFDLATDASTVLGFTKDAASALVSWRYKVDGGNWAVWPGSNVEYTFYKPATTVEFQAWTKCGQVGATVSFPVHLHIHAESKVCDYFCDMWYQTTHNKATPSSKELCMYPKADFAELTFDYHANIGLMYAKDKINMNIKEVTCTLHYDWTAATDKVEIVTSTTQDADIIKRIAVVAKRNPQTAALSGISVECVFRYKVFGKTELYEQSCPETFSIKDCTGPVIDEPPSSALSDPTCAADNCVTSGGPGPYEACGGNVVSVTSGATVLTTADQTCCQFCSPKFTTTCQALPQLPSGNSDIKLCVPTSTDSTATKYFGTNLLLATASEAISKSVATNPTATALLSASAMVALVALVVVRRRRAASASAGDVVVDDAYYPLLE